jgi:hypothetical protein
VQWPDAATDVNSWLLLCCEQMKMGATGVRPHGEGSFGRVFEFTLPCGARRAVKAQVGGVLYTLLPSADRLWLCSA